MSVNSSSQINSFLQQVFPTEPPLLSGIEVAGALFSGERSTGDFYDYWELSPGVWGFAVGDAVLTKRSSGQGLLAAAMQSFVRGFTKHQETLPDAMHTLNQLLHRELEENSFYMCSIMRLDPQTRIVDHIGAGHQVYVIDEHGKQKDRLESTGLPLGLFFDALYTMTPPYQLAPGDMVLLLTDGFQETVSPDNRLFGMQQVFEVIRENAQDPVADIIQKLQATAQEFQEEQPQRDDRTAVLVRVVE